MVALMAAPPKDPLPRVIVFDTERADDDAVLLGMGMVYD